MFFFQSFSDESPLGIELTQEQTVLNLESRTSFQWDERDINARVVLDLSVEEGQIQQLELDVDSNWTVDLIKAADITQVVHSFVEDAEPSAGNEPLPSIRWVVPLRRPVAPLQPVRLVVQLRRPLTTDEQSASFEPAQKHRYPLSDFLPIHVPGSRMGQQLIAFDSGRQYRLFADDRREIAALPLTRDRVREPFDELPQGTLFSIDESFRRHYLEMESLQPACEMTVVTNLVLQNGTLWETCRFSCTPAENSRVGRLVVRFSKHSRPHDGTDWTWTLGQESESFPRIKATRVLSKDFASPEKEETWELELTPSRSTPFEVTASRMVPFDTLQAIPLPFFPDMSGVNAQVHIETRDSTLYRVVQNQTRAVSLPVETTDASSPSVVRGIYQYIADNDAISAENAMLVLEPISVSARSHDGLADIRSLELHSHYFPDGKVVSFAVMALENRLLDRLKIRLPPGVSSDAVRHLWIDGEKKTWSFASGSEDIRDLIVSLPQRRHLTLTLEYVARGDELSDNTIVLRSAMPTFDVPVFSQKWYAWHPPQFRGFDASNTQGSVQRRDSAQSSGKRTHVDFRQWHTLFDRSTPRFTLFGTRRPPVSVPSHVKDEITASSIRLLKLLETPALEQRLRQHATASGTSETVFRDSSSGDNEFLSRLTWGELFASQVLRDTVAGNRPLTVLIDSDSLVQIGISPFHAVSPAIPLNGQPTHRDKGLALLERSRLAVIFYGNHNMLVTSAVTAAKLRSELAQVHANRFWYCPSDDLDGILASKNASCQSVLISPSQWQNNAQENQFPPRYFGMSVPSDVDMPGWVAHEMAGVAGFPMSIQLVRHDTLLTCQLFVFVVIVLVSCRIRPEHLIWVILPSATTIFLVRLFPPFFADLVPSAFWGLLCAFAFGLTRHMRANRGKMITRTGNDLTTFISSQDPDDDSEPGEVRVVVASSRSPDVRPDSGEISKTEIDSSSRNALLMLLVVTMGLLSLATRSLPAQSFTFAESFSATPLLNPPPSDDTPETPDTVSDFLRGIFESDDLPNPHRVFIPYDSQGRIGDRYIVPESLYLHLQRGAGETAISGRWRIDKAHYVGTLTQDPIQNEATLSQLRVIYEMELEDASAVVRLPEMPVAPDGIRCDNRLIRPTVVPLAFGDANRKEYVFPLSGQGRHRLEVALMPIIYGNEDMTSRRFDFPIPPVPDSTLELTLPTANWPVEVSQSFGQLSRQSDKLKASLGPTNQLSVSWPVRPSLPGNLAVSQFFRFHVTSDQVKLHARFHFTIPSGNIRQVLIMLDPRYKEGEWQASEIIESVETVSGTDNVRRMTFRHPVTQSVTVEFDCFPKNISGTGDFSGVGMLALPRFHAVSVHQINSSWLGVSSDPSVEVELPLSNVEPRIFENAWGLHDEPVHHAFDLLRPQDNWFLTVKSRQALKHIQQRQWLLFRNRSILAHLEEEVTPFHDKVLLQTTAPLSLETIPSFTHEIVLPEGFRCETVEVASDNGGRREKPRFHQKDRRLVVFFKEPVFGKYTVALSGTLPCEFHDEIPFPLFTHDDKAAVQRSVFCYRDTSVLVQQSPEEQSIEEMDVVPGLPSVISSGYFISAYRIKSLEHFLPATARMSPNKPEIRGAMVSRIERKFPFDRWEMAVACDITISDGELDQVSLFIPVRSNETFTVSQNVPSMQTQRITIIQTSKDDGTLVQLKPRVPLSGELSFEIRFPVGGTFDAVSVPNVRFLHDSELEHYVALPDDVTLPESSGYKPLTWTLGNLSPIDDVPPVRPSPMLLHDASTYRYYRAGHRDFSANIGLSHEATFVSCHSVTSFVRHNGFCFAVSEFDIQGNDLPSCDIAFPNDYRLIQVRLNDVSPLPERVDDTTIRVALLSDVPVQRLTLIYCSRQEMSGFGQASPVTTEGRTSDEPQFWQMTLPLPRMLSMSVRKTLWEVFYEPLPMADAEIEAFVNVSKGQEQSFHHQRMTALTPSEAGSLRVRMELARLSQTLTFFRLVSAQSQDEGKLSGRHAAWFRLWNETHRRATRFLPEWSMDISSKDKSFLLGKPGDLFSSDASHDAGEADFEANADMAWVESCFSRRKTPQAVYDDLVNQYKTLTGGMSWPAGQEPAPVAEAQSDMERDLEGTYFWDVPNRVRYLAGATPDAMTDLTLVFQPQKVSIPQDVYLHYGLCGAAGLIVFLLVVNRNTRRLFRHFSSLFVIALIVFCWLFIKPNLIGWAVLAIMLFSAIRIQWDQMRAATTAVTHNVPDQ
ncbi:MAG: hypothetical protein FWD31_02600 [Planctomycetaceae bacterium]|nr:hypothetical protein [Planctomycetaceae bacterium]